MRYLFFPCRNFPRNSFISQWVILTRPGTNTKTHTLEVYTFQRHIKPTTTNPFIYSSPLHSPTNFHSFSSTPLGGVRNMAALPTAEISDANASHVASGDVRVLQPVFQIYGQSRAFAGPIVTVKVFEDNVLVRELLETKGEGRVLVVDGGGSLRCALLGGNLAQIAQNNGWSGIVVNGCIRDVDEINACDIGVRALASNPLRSNKKRTGEKNVPVYVGGTFIREAEWLYADNDGILISKFELSN